VIKLYGFPISNYFNMVKAALLEKDVPFETVLVRPSQDPDYRAKSPMGKVPCLETSDGKFLSETQVLLEYLEELHPSPTLLPGDAFQRARIRELMHELELYIELPARTCYPAAFFGGQVADAVKEQARVAVSRGVQAIGQRVRFSPFIAGDQLSLADLVAIYTLPIADRAAQAVWQGQVLDELPGAAEWFKTMNQRPAMRKIAEDRSAAIAAAAG